MTSSATGSPRVSVIVAAYNAAATIRTAVASALEQRDVPLECIVVDDGSTDDTARIVASIAAADDRVVLLRQERNNGVSAARNLALDAAAGDWLTFLDADDRLRPGGLGTMLAAADADGSLAVVGQRISTDGRRTWFPGLYQQPDIRLPGRKSLAANPGLLYYVGPVGKLFHRSCTEGLRFEGRVLGDQPWVVRALVRAGDRITVIDTVVYEWWRPDPKHYVATLSSARERSASLGTEAVRMAGIAYDVATGEFERVYDPSTRARINAAYFARLIRADLAHQLRTAIRRRDRDLDGMLRALAALIAHVPGGVAAGSDAVARELLESPARGWPLLRSTARRAYWELVEGAVRADPGVLAKVQGSALRLTLRLAAVRVVGRPLSNAVLYLVGGMGGLDWLLRGRRPGR